MITRHHFALALICSLILFSSFLFTRPIIAFLVCTGTCIGSLLPDIHMSRPKKTGPRTLAWALVQLPRKACAWILYRIYAALELPVTDPTDKRLTHSLPGILFITLSSGLLLLIPAYIISPANTIDGIIFLFGLFLGMIFHLIEDLCTRKGIFPFFPLSQTQIAGSIRPCDHEDHRIRWFHVLHGGVLLILLILDGTGILVPALAFPAGLAGLAICLGIMVYLSDVTVRQASSPGARVQPAAVQGTGRR
ncbi:membrane-bound metal-dependent hydrolase [Methanoregula boonei 6A8]|uniref:Membrane-bound metal-dependent hydrolase n=1 Tax=Methanoregula boonei (strain DSM 21154 / JCM 14090 / 6A8) TaxID=456442 RepID=A7I6P5_METB6|nr:metal-dependent hydrolase [Methanoregula boonei]ABS55406.1 membrane-bound metal-dependent hydrolase [Methanoregula boonei 6A8]